MTEEKPRPTKDEIVIRRLRAQLKRTQARAARLSTEAGERYLKSLASVFVDRWKAEVKAHDATKQKLKEAQRELHEKRSLTADLALQHIRKLLDMSAATTSGGLK